MVLEFFVRIFPPDRRAGWVKSARTCDLRGK